MCSINVLLVDDEGDFLRTLGKRLSKRGNTVELAASGEEALNKLETFEADVVLLDVKMPGMDGLTLLSLIKQRWPLIEAIMLTGHASVEVAIRGMELGAFDYMMKPVKFERLYYKLEDAFRRKMHQEERIMAMVKNG
ncbi:Response regulator receiver domain-containing protein [Maridesulfovibrio ferrireducens]|uniref:Response regulator receiver domain-containing protein n=1 Tax=Maridesulfovibrio ferrireducens TaxID=246191 RepID=A0A1G9F093_9BACT|nr:response regulator [Maridesulfovibrio ferrireducens]SDK81738.1 Response regulator receiver domain-containing protein [Maridesulfovibrio ferrireducens]